MSDDSPTRPQSSQRRASFAPGSKISEVFGGQPYGGSIAAAAANASAHQRRRMSISTLGLSGSPNQPSPFVPNTKQRQESLSSTSTSPGSGWNPSGGFGIADESAIDDSADAGGTSPSHFVRRMSFGAKAMRDARGGGSPGFNGTPERASPSSTSHGSSGSMRKGSLRGRPGSLAGEGFNWSDQIRSRAERSASIAAPSAGTGGNYFGHQRSNTVASVEPPVKEPPRAPKAPDHFQERILKGDFYMD